VPYSKYKITIEQTSRISLKNKKGTASSAS